MGPGAGPHPCSECHAPQLLCVAVPPVRLLVPEIELLMTALGLEAISETIGTAHGLVEILTCPKFRYPWRCEDQAGTDGFFHA